MDLHAFVSTILTIQDQTHLQSHLNNQLQQSIAHDCFLGILPGLDLLEYHVDLGPELNDLQENFSFLLEIGVMAKHPDHELLHLPAT